MATESSSDRLLRLRGEVEVALTSFLEHTTLLMPASGASEPVGPGAGPGGPAPGPASQAPGQRGPASGPIPQAIGRSRAFSTALSHVRTLEGNVFAGNERALRELAKEIKRLISEDKRRGLGL